MTERTAVASYLMNPTEDIILFGTDLADGMWVLPENRIGRPGIEAAEDAQLRGQRFRRVTRLQPVRPPRGDLPAQMTFIAEWVDGYQEVYSGAVTNTWLVKKDSVTS
jgi:hypothetical protein